MLSKANTKYQVILLLLADTGVRVTECVRLRLWDLNFQDRTIVVKSLKKRGKDVERKILMSERLYQALLLYLPKIDTTSKENFLFPSPPEKMSKEGHISRKRVWEKLQKLSEHTVSPHMLRHTFATKIVKQTDLGVAQKLLGHASRATTEIYFHVDQQEMDQAVQAIHSKNKNVFTRWLETKFKTKKPFIPRHLLIHADKGKTDFIVGRKEEIKALYHNYTMRINTLIVGEAGIGKTHLTDNLKFENIIRIDDLSSLKKTLGGLLLELYKTKEAVIKHLTDNADIDTVITKESIKRLCELSCAAVSEFEYTIIIDDVSRITPSQVRALDYLKNHFHFIACARAVKTDYQSTFSNFRVIRLETFKRAEASYLIGRYAKKYSNKIKDMQHFVNVIFEESQGIPLRMIELVDNLQYEPVINEHTLSNISSEYKQKKEFDFTIVIIVLFGSMVIFRYLGPELGVDAGAYRLLGGVALVMLFFARPFLKVFKRKYI